MGSRVVSIVAFWLLGSALQFAWGHFYLSSRVGEGARGQRSLFVQRRGVGHSSILVAGGVGDKVKDVGQLSDIIATQVTESPVAGHGRDQGVVGIVGIVRRALQRRNGIAQQQGQDTVGLIRVIIGFIKSDHHQRVIQEVGVGQQRGQETRQPLTGISNRGIMSIVPDAGGVERVVGEGTVVEIGLELGGRDDMRVATGYVLGDEVKAHKRVVLAEVKRVGGSAGVAGRGHVFHVTLPGQLLVLDQIDHSVVRSIKFSVAVGGDVIVITRNGGYVVGLRWMGQAVVVVKENSLRKEGLEVGVRVGKRKVLLLLIEKNCPSVSFKVKSTGQDDNKRNY